jgi:hypothetical protein
MPRFEHPFQLFTIDYPENWEPMYQEETGGLILVNPGDESNAGALSLTPIAVNGELPPAMLALEVNAKQIGSDLDRATLRDSKRDGFEVAQGEGTGTASIPGSKLRFWVIRQPKVALNVVQLGPAASDTVQRAHADLALESLSFPEIMPPTPAEFQARVLEILAREHPELTAEADGEWGIKLALANGDPHYTLGLENLYRSCLLNAESIGALIREHLEKLLADTPTVEDFPHFADARPHLMPMLKPSDWSIETRDIQLPQIQFAPGLVLFFVIDQPDQVVFVNAEHLKRWDVPQERLEEVAFDNLAERSKGLQLALMQDDEGNTAGVVLSTNDGYDAARFALVDLRDRLAGLLGDEFYVGVPNRDFLIAFSRRDVETAVTISRQVRTDYQRMNYPLSPETFLVRPDRIEVADL